MQFIPWTDDIPLIVYFCASIYVYYIPRTCLKELPHNCQPKHKSGISSTELLLLMTSHFDVVVNVVVQDDMRGGIREIKYCPQLHQEFLDEAEEESRVKEISIALELAPNYHGFTRSSLVGIRSRLRKQFWEKRNLLIPSITLATVIFNRNLWVITTIILFLDQFFLIDQPISCPKDRIRNPFLIRNSF